MLNNLSEISHLLAFVYKMFHGNFCEKNHFVVPYFSCVSCVGFAVVSDLQSDTIEYEHL